MAPGKLAQRSGEHVAGLLGCTMGLAAEGYAVRIVQRCDEEMGGAQTARDAHKDEVRADARS
jgi:hypothetical protein